MTTKRCRCLDKLTPVKLKELRFKEMSLFVSCEEYGSERNVSNYIYECVCVCFKCIHEK